MKRRKNYLPYKDAEEIVKKLNFNNIADWYKNKSKLVKDIIPIKPNLVYKDIGWIDWYTFFGKSKTSKWNFLSYDDAVIYVHKLEIKTMNEYKKYIRVNKISNLPLKPEIFYKNKGWINWKTFSGSNNLSPMNRNFLSYDDAVIYVHKLNLKSISEWNEYIKDHRDIINLPVCPPNFYKDKGWINWSNFLNKPQLLSYDDAVKFAHSLKLHTQKEWINFHKKNNIKNITTCPQKTYKNKGWISWQAFLGYQTSNISSHAKQIEMFLMRNHIFFTKEKTFKHDNDIKRFRFDFYLDNFNILIEYDGIQHYEPKSKFGGEIGYKNTQINDKLKNEWCEKSNIPLIRIPYTVENIDVYLTDQLNIFDIKLYNSDYYTYDESKQYIKELNITNISQFYELFRTNKIDKKIPLQPYIVYCDKWINWKDWTNNDVVVNSKYLGFDDAKKYVHTLNLKTYNEWRLYSKTKRPPNIPSKPSKIYKGQWINYFDWLGYTKNNNIL